MNKTESSRTTKRAAAGWLRRLVRRQRERRNTMDITDMKLWEFNPPLDGGCEIKCPECDEWSPPEEWKEGEVGCEDCGSHSAMVCPKCDERFDHVFSPTFETRLMSPNEKS